MLDFNGAPDRLWWGGDVSEVYSGSDLVWTADAGQFIHTKGDFALRYYPWLSLGKVTMDVRGGVFVGVKYPGGNATTWAEGAMPRVRLTSGSRVETFLFPEKGAFTHTGAAHWVDPGTWHVEVGWTQEGTHLPGVEELVVAASSSKGEYRGWNHGTPDDFNSGAMMGLRTLRTVPAPVRSRRLVTVRGEFTDGTYSYPSSIAYYPQVQIGGHLSRNVGKGEFSFWEIVDGPTEVGLRRNHPNTVFSRNNVFFDGRVDYIDLPD